MCHRIAIDALLTLVPEMVLRGTHRGWFLLFFLGECSVPNTEELTKILNES
jgi:hypothetical protein